MFCLVPMTLSGGAPQGPMPSSLFQIKETIAEKHPSQRSLEKHSVKERGRNAVFIIGTKNLNANIAMPYPILCHAFNARCRNVDRAIHSTSHTQAHQSPYLPKPKNLNLEKPVPHIPQVPPRSSTRVCKSLGTARRLRSATATPLYHP